MMFKHVSTTLRTCALVGLFVALSHASASAATFVTFSTTGVFNGGPGNSVTFTSSPGNSTQFTFNGATSSTFGPFPDIPFSNAGLGDVQVVVTGTGYNNGATSTPFTLTIHQTSPTTGDADVAGTLTGNVSILTGGNFQLNFNSPTVTIGDVTYGIDPFYRITPVLSGCGGGAQCGDTSIQGTVTTLGLNQTGNEVPEPATMVLLGTGLLAAFRARRHSA